MRYKALCVFRCAIAVVSGAAAPLLLLLLLLLLLSIVVCACTVMISLVVVISRDFESQLKSSGHATHNHSFYPE